MARSVNHYSFLGVPAGVFFMGPAFLVFWDAAPPILEILPATLLLRVITGALGFPHRIPGAGHSSVSWWYVPASLLAAGAFARSTTQGGGHGT